MIDRELPRVKITKEDIRKFCRLEITYSEFKHGQEEAPIDCNEPYMITLDDLYAALKNKTNFSEEDFVEWFFVLWDELYCLISIEDVFEKVGKEIAESRGYPTDYSVFGETWDVIQSVCEYEAEMDLDQAISDIETYYQNREKPEEDRELTDNQKRSFLQFWDDEGLDDAPEKYKLKYREFVDCFCDKKDPDYLEFKAYACYGNPEEPYEQDWKASEECLLTLMEVQPSAKWANTLGYIYYYGRVNGGVPEYDKAFKYFSIGAAGWYYESRYKLADMFIHGYGVAKDPGIASSLIWELYRENIKYIRKGDMRSNFADVALRAGNLYKNGIEWSIRSEDNALYYYFQARYAIRQRMKATDYYGDSKVAKGIEDAINEVLPNSNFARRRFTVHYNSLNWLLSDAIDRKHKAEMTITHLKNNEYSLSFRLVPFEDEWGGKPKMLITVPEAWYCEQRSKITVRVKTEEPPEYESEVIQFDNIHGTGFYNYGKKVADFTGDYIFKAPKRDI